MNNNPLIPESKLPALGTTIFTQMSALAQQHQAINLSQGFPDFDGPRYLQERLAYHVAQGANQYAPMTGVPALREAIAGKTAELYGYQPDVNSEITVTAGATEALYAAITALVRRGDEVICFDPSYDSYAPAVALAGGELRRIALQPPHFRVDWRQFAAALSEKTRLVILNTPHNPSATVWQREDFAALWQAIAAREIYVLSDEVYEHICFAEGGHASVLAHPQLRERAVAVSSFGKTFHMTGWKVGYCVAPAAISAELRKVHQYLTFSVNTRRSWRSPTCCAKRRSIIVSCRRFIGNVAICLLKRCVPAGWKSCPVKGPISCWRTTAPSPILTISASAAG